MNEKYYIENCTTEEHLQEYKKCFDNNGSPKDLKRLSWMHLNNPINKCLVDFAKTKKDNNLGGIYAVFPIYFKYFNQYILGSQSIDTLVDKNHRKQGLFKKLANSIYSRCIDENLTFVYGFPNINSSFAFFNRLEWTEISNIPFLIKPLKLSYFKDKLKTKSKILSYLIPKITIAKKRKLKIKTDFTIKSIEKFNHETDLIWNEFSKHFNIGIERNASYLNWRIFQKPNFSYKVYGLYFKEKLVAYIIYNLTEKHGGKIGYVLELMYLDSYKQEANYLMQKAINDFIEQDTDAILAWNFSHSPNHSIFRKNRFLNLPNFLRPIKLFFGIRFFNQTEHAQVSVNDWYLSYCDSDTV